MNMHAASGRCTHGVSNVGSVTAGQPRHNSSNVGGVTAGQVRHNSSNNNNKIQHLYIAIFTECSVELYIVSRII